MKKTIISLAMASLMTVSAWGVSAAPSHQKQGPPKNYGLGFKQTHSGPGRSQFRSDAKYVIERTARVLNQAQRSAKRGRYHSGLGRAVSHQQRARELYAKRDYREAIYFSLRSRELAIEIIERNRGKVRPDFRMDKREQRYKGGPGGRNLDAKLDPKKMRKDKDALKITIELNL